MSVAATLDKNFHVETSLTRENLVFLDVNEPCFRLHGVVFDGERYRRIPKEIAENTNRGVAYFHNHTTGGRVRFVTDSSFVAISAKLNCIDRMPHFALTGSCGFDLYETIDGKQQYLRSFVPKYQMTDGYENLIDLGEARERELTINFPLYSGVSQLYIGLDRNAQVRPAPDYTHAAPVVYYGASIVQGGCASRPGNTYPAMVSQWLDCDFLDLGFSGNARGEEIITDYINNLEMSAFVYSYTFSLNTDFLKETHEKMYKAIRAKHPELPILILQRMKVRPDAEDIAHNDIIAETYQNAVAAGDKYVRLLTSRELSGLLADADMPVNGTVDGTHPNDLGFYFAARCVAEALKPMLK